MLTPQTLTQTLLKLGFQQAEDQPHFCVGSLHVQLLDGPRIRVTTPAGGLHYIAVLSSQHLLQELAALPGCPPLLRD